jgi:hypothetical protein
MSNRRMPRGQLVVRFRSSHQNAPQTLAGFGIGTPVDFPAFALACLANIIGNTAQNWQIP